MIRLAPLSLIAALAATPALAAPEAYVLDAGHSQIVFSYNHMGFSTSYGMFSGFDGAISFDAEAPANSTVAVEFPVASMLTGWQERFDHFMTADFFNAEVNKTVSFVSTGIEVTGDSTAKISGDLTMNGVTRPVVLDTVLNQKGDHPMEKKPWLGFSATTSVLRSEFNLGMFAPFISDEVKIEISVEAKKAE